MLGAIVVKDQASADGNVAGLDGGDTKDLVMVVSEVQLTTRSKTRKSLPNDHALMADAMPLRLRNPGGDETLKFLAVNGQQGGRLVVDPRRVYRLRLVNAVMDGYLRLSAAPPAHFPEGAAPPCLLAEVAADGVSYAAPRPVAGAVPTGSRRDLLLRCTADAVLRSGPAKAPDATDEFMGAGSAIATGELLQIFVKAGRGDSHKKHHLRDRKNGDGAIPLTTAFESYRFAQAGRLYGPEPLGDLRTAVVAPEDRHVIYYTQSGPASVRETRADGNVHPFLGFDGRRYSDHPPLVVRRDAVTEITVVNERCLDGSPAYESHPFHMHTNHFQVIGAAKANATYDGGDDSPDFRVGDWRDTIAVPAPGRATVRFVPRVYAGDSLVHVSGSLTSSLPRTPRRMPRPYSSCALALVVLPAKCHTLVHEDVGMMLKLKIV